MHGGVVVFGVVVLELDGEHDGAVDGDGKAAVTASEHDEADDEFGEWAERAGERVVCLFVKSVSVDCVDGAVRRDTNVGKAE